MEKFEKITRTYENCLRQQSLSKTIYTQETPENSEKVAKDLKTFKPVNVPFGTKLLPLTTMVLPMIMSSSIFTTPKPLKMVQFLDYNSPTGLHSLPLLLFIFKTQ